MNQTAAGAVVRRKDFTMRANQLFAFLPYIRTRERCSIRGIEFRCIKDVDGLDAEAKKHVETLGRMFFTCQGGRIAEPTFAVVSAPNDEALATAHRLLTEAQLLVTYLYGSPHPSPTISDDIFLDAECSTMFTFVPNRVASSLVTTTKSEVGHGRVIVEDAESLPASDFIEGYDGYRNRVVPLWVAEGSHIYPEIPNICLNYSQYLDNHVQQFLSAPKNWPFRPLFGRHDMSPDNQGRVFTSLLWYGRSCRSSAGQAERLLYLAVAMETLLDLEKGERLTDRFKEAVTTLVGPVPRLDEWVDQFYSARSTTVHQGRPNQLWFVAPITKKDTLPHRALIVYGRRIFRICLTAVLTGAILTHESRVASLLVHNNERLEEICEAIAGEDVPARDRLVAVKGQIEELHGCETLSFGPRLEEDLDKLFGAARLIVKAYLQCKQIDSTELDAHLETVVASTGTTAARETYEALQKMTDILRKEVRAEGKGSESDEIALRFIEFAGRPAVGLESHLRDAGLQRGNGAEG